MSAIPRGSNDTVETYERAARYTILPSTCDLELRRLLDEDLEELVVDPLLYIETTSRGAVLSRVPQNTERSPGRSCNPVNVCLMGNRDIRPWSRSTELKMRLGDLPPSSSETYAI